MTSYIGSAPTQSVHPNEAGYTPAGPPDSIRLEPRTVTARAATIRGTVTEQAFGAIEHARNEFEKHMADLQQNRNLYTSEGYADQVSRFANTDAAKAIDTAQANVEARVTQAEAKVEKVRAALSPNGDAAAESRAARFWHRNERLLDAKQDKFTAAQDLVKSASREELGTLLQELPAYLQANGLETGWLDIYVASIVPEYGAAKTELQKATAANQLITAAANTLRSGLKNGKAPAADHLARLNPATAGQKTTYRDSKEVTYGTHYDPDK